MIGKVLAQYQISEKLGEGGMRIVWKARGTHLDRFVALKTLPAERLADAERRRRSVGACRNGYPADCGDRAWILVSSPQIAPSTESCSSRELSGPPANSCFFTRRVGLESGLPGGHFPVSRSTARKACRRRVRTRSFCLV
jgi:serine/threonine protein kinase